MEGSVHPAYGRVVESRQLKLDRGSRPNDGRRAADRGPRAGLLVRAAPPSEFFSDLGDPEIVGIRPPHVTVLMDRLKAEGAATGPLPVDLEDGVRAVAKVLEGQG